VTAPPEDESVELLLDAVSHGDREAFSRLYDHLAPRVLGLTIRVLRDPAQAEEVMQDVFLEIWRGARAFDPGRGRGITWVLTMTHRRAIDRVRSSQSSRDRDDRIGIRDLADPGETIEEIVETTIERERVTRAMSELSEIQREAIALAYYRGFTQTEIARKLDVPLGTVKTRTRDAMLKLKGILGERS
jgi:RNA polymerase sigma-70 factor (ECF subfamily)